MGGAVTDGVLWGVGGEEPGMGAQGIPGQGNLAMAQ